MQENSLLEMTAHLVLQLGVILLLAKLAAEVCVRYLNQPAVLGELVVGILISPYLLGSMIHLPGLPHGLDTLFPPGQAVSPEIPVSDALWVIAQVGVVTLLFMAGLETDLRQFLRYGGAATLVALGGVIFPFLLGDLATVWFGFADGFWDPVAMFMGAIMVATSVGITARVLSDIGKLTTPEGVTIMAGAVIDDVLGLLVLAIVVAIGVGGGETELSGLLILKKAAWAFGFWIGLTALGVFLSKRISRFVLWFRAEGSHVALGLALCFLVASVTELIGRLAMIIGAYSIGLALSETKLADDLEEQLQPLYAGIVPIFFVVMGMLVDVTAMAPVLLFGTVITLLAIVTKVIGAGAPALAVGFNSVGALRIGIGMLPRGEVALIVAGVGIAARVIDQDIFGVSVMMTMVTTLMAPVILVPIFERWGEGRRRLEEPSSADQEATKP